MIPKVYYVDKGTKQSSEFDLKCIFRSNNTVQATKQQSFVRVDNILEKR